LVTPTPPDFASLVQAEAIQLVQHCDDGIDQREKIKIVSHFYNNPQAHVIYLALDKEGVVARSVEFWFWRGSTYLAVLIFFTLFLHLYLTVHSIYCSTVQTKIFMTVSVRATLLT
jgi:hypothetical protein